MTSGVTLLRYVLLNCWLPLVQGTVKVKSIFRKGGVLKVGKCWDIKGEAKHWEMGDRENLGMAGCRASAVQGQANGMEV